MSNKAYYKRLIIDKRLQISRERDAKKRDNESYARMIKGATSAAGKANYRKTKIQKSDDHNRCIERLKQEILRLQYEMSKAPK